MSPPLLSGQALGRRSDERRCRRTPFSFAVARAGGRSRIITKRVIGARSKPLGNLLARFAIWGQAGEASTRRTAGGAPLSHGGQPRRTSRTYRAGLGVCLAQQLVCPILGVMPLFGEQREHIVMSVPRASPCRRICTARSRLAPLGYGLVTCNRDIGRAVYERLARFGHATARL
jgi:hypothetical protein